MGITLLDPRRRDKPVVNSLSHLVTSTGSAVSTVSTTSATTVTSAATSSSTIITNTVASATESATPATTTATATATTTPSQATNALNPVTAVLLAIFLLFFVVGACVIAVKWFQARRSGSYKHTRMAPHIVQSTYSADDGASIRTKDDMFDKSSRASLTVYVPEEQRHRRLSTSSVGKLLPVIVGVAVAADEAKDQQERGQEYRGLVRNNGGDAASRISQELRPIRRSQHRSRSVSCSSRYYDATALENQ